MRCHDDVMWYHVDVMRCHDECHDDVMGIEMVIKVLLPYTRSNISCKEKVGVYPL